MCFVDKFEKRKKRSKQHTVGLRGVSENEEKGSVWGGLCCVKKQRLREREESWDEAEGT